MSGNGGWFTIHQVWKPNSKYWEHETISQTLDLTLKLLNPHHLKRHEIILHGKTHSCVDSLWLSACFIATSRSGNRKWSSLKRLQPQEIFETVAKHCWENAAVVLAAVSGFQTPSGPEVEVLKSFHQIFIWGLIRKVCSWGLWWRSLLSFWEVASDICLGPPLLDLIC